MIPELGLLGLPGFIEVESFIGEATKTPMLVMVMHGFSLSGKKRDP